VSEATDIYDEMSNDAQYPFRNRAWLHETGVIINSMQRSDPSLREIQYFGMFAMRNLGKLEVKLVKIITGLRGESVVDQAEHFAGL
jgi:hypothetical protein